MKEDIPYTYDEIRNIHPQIDEAQRRLGTKPSRAAMAPAQVKRLIDDRWRVGHIPQLIRGEEYGFTEQQLAAHEVTVLRDGASLRRLSVCRRSGRELLRI